MSCCCCCAAQWGTAALSTSVGNAAHAADAACLSAPWHATTAFCIAAASVIERAPKNEVKCSLRTLWIVERGRGEERV